MPRLKIAAAALAIAALAGTQTPVMSADASLPAWMAGRWCGVQGGQRIEEVWLAPDGGLMLGMGRTVFASGQRPAQFEFLRVELRDGVPTYLAHPQGAPAVAFKLTQSGEQSVRFENPVHDFPQRIEYRRNGRSMRAEIAGPRGGQERVIGFDYLACDAEGKKL
jgi:hypothetical protein